jgi:Xaa-Pro aminopeptidase
MSEEFRFPANEIDFRKNRIQKELRDSGIDGLFIVQRADLLYFSGTAQSAFLYMPSSGEPLLCVKRYMPRAQEESPIKNIVKIESIRDIPSLISDYFGKLPPVLAFEFDVLPVQDFNFYRSLFPVREHVDGSLLIHKVRMIKSSWEIRQIEKTAELSQKTFEYMKSVIRPGLTEMEFASMYEAFARGLGHGGMLRVRDFLTEGYSWHVLSGKSGGMVGLLDSPVSGEGTSVAFPCGAGKKPLKPNEPIMVDFSSVLNGYHMDETRMFSIGAMSYKATEACKAEIEIHNTVLEKVKPGVATGELYEVSRAKAKSLGYEEQFLGPPEYKVTFIGHAVGLELVEAPIIAKGRKDPLLPGMAIALEPKMIFQNEFSAGIESVFLVTEKGYRMISKTPVEIFVC